MSDEKSKWTADIDKEIAEKAEMRLEYGEKTEIIERVAEVIANRGLDERTPYDARIRQLKTQLREKRLERDEIQDEIDEMENEIETLVDKRERFESPEDKLEGALASLDSLLRRSGMHIHEEQVQVVDVAREHGLSAEQVVGRMKQRNPDVPPHAFSNPDDDQYFDDWYGFADGSKAALPPDERENDYDHET